MSAAPTFSTVIPAFNAAETIAETLDSIQAQTCEAANEVLVVDDGSDDATADIAAAHAIAPRVIRTANEGAAAAMNTGIGAASGGLLCFLDADDLWTPDKLAVQLALLEGGGAPDAAFGHVEAFECPSVAPEAFASLTYQRGKVPGYLVSTLMVRRALMVERFGPFDTSFRTGYFIEWYRTARAMGMRHAMAEETVLRRRIRPGTLSMRTDDGGHGLSKDFLEIARRALAQKRASEN